MPRINPFADWFYKNNEDRMFYKIKLNLGIIAFGAAIFFVSLAFFQFLFKFFKCYTHHRQSNKLGFIAFVLSSYLSNYAMIHVLKIMNCVSLLQPFTIHHCVLFSIVYFCLVSRVSFSNFLASSVLHCGAFAVKGFALSDYTKHVTDRQRSIVLEFGYKNGCHSCGKIHFKLWRRMRELYCYLADVKKPIADYFADHQPPQAVAKVDKVNTGKLFPHCHHCSYHQADCVKKALKSKNWEEHSSDHVVTHYMQLRFWKFQLPWPVFIQNRHFFFMLLNYALDYVTVIHHNLCNCL